MRLRVGLCGSQAPLAGMASSPPRGQGGSYIAMVTALLVVNWENLTGSRGVASPWAWALPTVVGSPIIAWVTREVALGRRPKL